MSPYDPTIIPALDMLASDDNQRPYLGNIHVFGHLVVVSDGFVMAALDWSVFGLDLSALNGRRLSPAQWKALRVPKAKSNPHYELAPEGVNGCVLRIKSGLGEFSVYHDCSAKPLAKPLLSFYPAPDPDKLDATPILRFNPPILDKLIQATSSAQTRPALTATLLLPAEAKGPVVVLLRGATADGAKAAIGTGLLLGVHVDGLTLNQDMAMYASVTGARS